MLRQGATIKFYGSVQNLKSNCFKASSDDSSIDLQTGTVTNDFYLEVKGSAYIRKDGPLDKGPIKVKITDPQGAVVLEKTIDDIYATEFTDEVVPAVPQIIERGTKVVITTKWVDEADNHELKPATESDTPGEAGTFDGYEFVKTVTSDDTTTHIYKRKVETVTPTPKTPEEPQKTPDNPTVPNPPHIGSDVAKHLEEVQKEIPQVTPKPQEPAEKKKVDPPVSVQANSTVATSSQTPINVQHHDSESAANSTAASPSQESNKGRLASTGFELSTVTFAGLALLASSVAIFISRKRKQF